MAIPILIFETILPETSVVTVALFCNRIPAEAFSSPIQFEILLLEIFILSLPFPTLIPDLVQLGVPPRPPSDISLPIIRTLLLFPESPTPYVVIFSILLFNISIFEEPEGQIAAVPFQGVAVSHNMFLK